MILLRQRDLDQLSTGAMSTIQSLQDELAQTQAKLLLAQETQQGQQEQGLSPSSPGASGFPPQLLRAKLERRSPNNVCSRTEADVEHQRALEAMQQQHEQELQAVQGRLAKVSAAASAAAAGEQQQQQQQQRRQQETELQTALATSLEEREREHEAAKRESAKMAEQASATIVKLRAEHKEADQAAARQLATAQQQAEQLAQQNLRLQSRQSQVLADATAAVTAQATATITGLQVELGEARAQQAGYKAEAEATASLLGQKLDMLTKESGSRQFKLDLALKAAQQDNERLTTELQRANESVASVQQEFLASSASLEQALAERERLADDAGRAKVLKRELAEEQQQRQLAEECLQKVLHDVSAATRTVSEVKAWQENCRLAILDAVAMAAKAVGVQDARYGIAEIERLVMIGFDHDDARVFEAKLAAARDQAANQSRDFCPQIEEQKEDDEPATEVEMDQEGGEQASALDLARARELVAFAQQELQSLRQATVAAREVHTAQIARLQQQIFALQGSHGAQGLRDLQVQLKNRLAQEQQKRQDVEQVAADLAKRLEEANVRMAAAKAEAQAMAVGAAQQQHMVIKMKEAVTAAALRVSEAEAQAATVKIASEAAAQAALDENFGLAAKYDSVVEAMRIQHHQELQAAAQRTATAESARPAVLPTVLSPRAADCAKEKEEWGSQYLEEQDDDDNADGAANDKLSDEKKKGQQRRPIDASTEEQNNKLVSEIAQQQQLMEEMKKQHAQELKAAREEAAKAASSQKSSQQQVKPSVVKVSTVPREQLMTAETEIKRLNKELLNAKATLAEQDATGGADELAAARKEVEMSKTQLEHVKKQLHDAQRNAEPHAQELSNVREKMVGQKVKKLEARSAPVERHGDESGSASSQPLEGVEALTHRSPNTPPPRAEPEPESFDMMRRMQAGAEMTKVQLELQDKTTELEKKTTELRVAEGEVEKLRDTLNTVVHSEREQAEREDAWRQRLETAANTLSGVDAAAAARSTAADKAACVLREAMVAWALSIWSTALTATGWALASPMKGARGRWGFVHALHKLTSTGGKGGEKWWALNRPPPPSGADLITDIRTVAGLLCAVHAAVSGGVYGGKENTSSSFGGPALTRLGREASAVQTALAQRGIVFSSPSAASSSSSSPSSSASSSAVVAKIGGKAAEQAAERLHQLLAQHCQFTAIDEERAAVLVAKFGQQQNNKNQPHQQQQHKLQSSVTTAISRFDDNVAAVKAETEAALEGLSPILSESRDALLQAHVTSSPPSSRQLLLTPSPSESSADYHHPQSTDSPNAAVAVEPQHAEGGQSGFSDDGRLLAAQVADAEAAADQAAAAVEHHLRLVPATTTDARSSQGSKQARRSGFPIDQPEVCV